MREFYEDIAHASPYIRSLSFDEAIQLGNRHHRAGDTLDALCTIKSALMLDWYHSGCPVFQLSEKAVDAIAFTEAPDRLDAPFRCFGFELPYQVQCGDGGEIRARYGIACTVAGLLGKKANNRWMVTVPVLGGQGYMVDVKSDVIDALLSGLCGLLASGAKKTPGAKRGAHSLPARRARAEVNVWRIDPPIETSIPVGAAREYISRGVSCPKSFKIGKRFMVRGHWRNQACGKGMQDRKQLWVQPYLKGPDDAEAWSRVYKVKGQTA